MRFLSTLILLLGLSSALYGQSFYRYLDLTPTMDLIPRGEIDSELVNLMVCFELTSYGDTLEIHRLDRGEPTPVFNFPTGFSVVTTDSLIIWRGLNNDPIGYLIDLDDTGLPVLMSDLNSNSFLEWVWDDEFTLVVYSIDSLGERIDIELPPNFTGTAIRLSDEGDLEYFKYESISASGWQYVIDNHRRVLSKEAVDASGEVVVSSDGIVETTYTYDESGNLMSTRMLDIHGNLMPNDYAVTNSGNYSFDENGVVRNEVNLAYTQQEFDENSLYILERNYGVDGNPIENSFGVSSIEYKRELLGGISESAWFDIDGNRTEIEGICLTRRIFNEQGRVIESSTYNANLEIADFPGGFAYTRFSYSENGELELISYYNSHGLPVINSSLGCHARSFVYDDGGRCTDLSYLDTEYNLVNLNTGYARVVSVFDEDGNLVEHRFYDRNGLDVK